MKLLLENWRKYMIEGEQQQLFKGCKLIVAYHGSKDKFVKFDMGFANPEDHAGKGLYFTTDREEVRRSFRYVYKVKLNICEGVQYPEEPNPEIHNHVYDKGYSGDTVYRILRDEDIEILSVEESDSRYWPQQ